MKITITKEWFRSRAHLEEGHEIGAGSLQHIGKPALHSLPGNPSSPNASSDNVGFGQAIALMRRHRRWTIDRLAKEAEATSEELAAIERNPDFVPELSTVVSLATTFGIPPKAMIYKAGLANAAPSRLHEDSVRYAACSEFKEPLSSDEEHVLQAVLKAIVEHSDPQ
jgi:DNA-binding XRE family transcriptional regulator